MKSSSLYCSNRANGSEAATPRSVETADVLILYHRPVRDSFDSPVLPVCHTESLASGLPTERTEGVRGKFWKYMKISN